MSWSSDVREWKTIKMSSCGAYSSELFYKKSVCVDVNTSMWQTLNIFFTLFTLSFAVNASGNIISLYSITSDLFKCILHMNTPLVQKLKFCLFNSIDFPIRIGLIVAHSFTEFLQLFAISNTIPHCKIVNRN